MPVNVPAIPGLRESLHGLTVHECETRPEGGTLLRADLGRIDGSVATSVPELWLTTTGPLRVEALVRVVARLLREVEHESSESVAGLVLAMYALNTARDDRTDEGLARFFENVADASAEVHFVIPALAGITASFTIGSFTFERTNVHRLKDLCERVGCDYAVRYGARLEGTQSIRSTPVPCRIFPKALVLEPSPLRYRVHDDYMGAVARSTREAVARAYTEETALLSIAHEWIFPLERLVRYAPLPCITLFRERAHPNSRGWVVPTISSFQIIHSTEFWPAGAKLSQQWRESSIGCLSPRDDFPGWLQTPSKLVVAAMAHRDGREWDLAGLIATTAAELLLCVEKQDLQKAVCERGSCICSHGDSSVSHLGEARIRALYTARSAFVHSGTPIGQGEAEDLVLLSRAAVFAAARTVAGAAQPRITDRDGWIRKLDAIRAAKAASLPLDPSVLRTAGLIQ
jgi:hypothetical protein